jgi:peroxiredoxin-like protein
MVVTSCLSDRHPQSPTFSGNEFRLSLRLLEGRAIMEVSMPDYRYYTSAIWTEGRKGTVSAEAIAEPARFSAPPEFMGEAGTWTPEHFFAAAIASCFVTTFKAIAEFSKFEFLSLRVEVEAILEKEQGGFSFTKVVVQPLLEIAPAADRQRATRLLEKAERACLISRSAKSEIEFQPEPRRWRRRIGRYR